MPRAHVLLPTLEREGSLWHQGIERIAGVDEVGRGAIAGVVMAAAVILPVSLDVGQLERRLSGVRDSKKLTAAQRLTLDQRIREVAVAVGLGGATVREIEQHNIRGATILAMRRALAQVQPVNLALVDGLPLKELGIPHQAIVKGDGCCLSIAAASIVAKVARDRAMQQLSRRYGGYGWERNVGYGTAQHYQALTRLGQTRHHRGSFLGRWQNTKV